MPPDPAPRPSVIQQISSRSAREVTQLPDGRRQTFYSVRKADPASDAAVPALAP